MWAAVLDLVGSGSADWIDLAGRLAPGATSFKGDLVSGSAEQLTAALTKALRTDPLAVLGVLRPESSGAAGLEPVCAANTFKASGGNDAVFAEAEAKLRAVRSARLAPVRDACLAFLKAPGHPAWLGDPGGFGFSPRPRSDDSSR